MSFILTILGLGIVVFLHELGHMLAAKHAGIGVSEFSVGMGPVVLKKQFGETVYSIRLLPLGGFVKLAGLDDDSDSTAENAYPNKSIWQRFWTIFWGPLMNFLLGAVLFFGIFAYQGVPSSDAMQINTVMASLPAAEIGLQKGDKLLAVNDIQLKSVRQLTYYLSKNKDKPIVLTINRLEDIFTVSLAPEYHQKKYVLGITFDVSSRRGSIGELFYYTGVMTKEYTLSVFKGIGLLVSGGASLKDMTGPIGIIQFASFNLAKGFGYFLNVMAMISISLGVINLFPLPVLDGGHIVMLLIEGVRGKPLSKKWFIMANNIGAAMLITLMVVVVVNDIRFWQDRVTLFQYLLKP